MRQETNIKFQIEAIKTKIQRLEKISTMAAVPYDLVEIDSNSNNIIVKLIIDTSDIEIEVDFASFSNISSFHESLNHHIKHKITKLLVELQKKLIAHQYELQFLYELLNKNRQ